MAAGQGINRLQAGIERKLTKHEFARGYIFVTLDKRLDEVLDVDGFTASVDGVTFPNRRISVSGRFSVSSVFLAKCAAMKGRVRIELKSRKLLVVRPVHG